ncbi:adenylate/guanylate cyclase domain-containing protein [Mesorhizobium sp.]|uniref:adenylate/guanylate cyclase domain-containing protein n=1 Tax=Mesorhizobium sp. TaxID=1871066 RepID=UPI00120D6677|nr:adenylate/guanylate cyclase domain-containing protein [Mesorhizobium sp.]TIL44599.1 MAG: adenylate/guanylate cyclase domain-containing protein [Mesorhizobium sp.]
MDRKLAAILAADVVGYSSLMEQDEQGTFERLRAGRKELIEPEIARHHGRIFKLMGDGLLAEFGSVVDAVECGVAVQRGLAERNDALPEDERIRVRIGINLGEVIVDGKDRYGEGVNIATRLEQIAEPGSVYVSGKVAKEVEGKLAFGFESMGDQWVKNLAEPVSVFRVNLADATRGKRLFRGRRRGWTKWAGITAAGLLAAVAGGLAWFGPSTQMFAPPAEAGVPAIAVLAFDNMTGDPTLDYFSDGVTEDIIMMLARSPDVSVIARNSSFTYKGKPTDVRQIGRELGVGFVLEGSVRKDADKVRIVAQLINAKTGEHVWADRFDEAGSDPMALQDAVTGKIVGAIAGDKGQVKQAAYRDAWGKDAANLEEYDYYLRGHDKFLKFSSESFEEAARIWTEGLSKFPASALLKLKLGLYHYFNADFGWSDDLAYDYRKAGELAREAMRSNNLSPLEQKLGHWLLAHVHSQEGDFKRSMDEAELALKMYPNDAWMSVILSQVAVQAGQPDKAITWVDFGIRNDPANSSYYACAFKGSALQMAERYQESADILHECGDSSIYVLLEQSINDTRLGRPEEAKAYVARALKLQSTFTAKKWRATSIHSDPKVIDREVADLIKAGLPDK